jgi:tRNA (guanine37-N1)-methyltransferase
MRCELLTLLPDLVSGVLGQSMLKRAQEKGLLAVHVGNLRDYTEDRHKMADDAPYGGGAGMVMKPEPFVRAVEALRADHDGRGPSSELRVIMPSPQGRPFSQQIAQELSEETRTIVFLCGHYEGIDERVRISLKPEEISIGDYVLTGGELAALVMIDAAARLIPGVLGDPESALLDYPHYTRPPEFRGLAVPEILLSGNHEHIRRWRRKEALRSTYVKRPDLLRDRVLSAEDRMLLDEILHERTPSTAVECGEEG